MTKSNFKFYQPDDVYGTLFFQFPKVLIYGDKYNKLSSDAKIAYMLLKDKLEFSIKNGFCCKAILLLDLFESQYLLLPELLVNFIGK